MQPSGLEKIKKFLGNIFIERFGLMRQRRHAGFHDPVKFQMGLKFGITGLLEQPFFKGQVSLGVLIQPPEKLLKPPGWLNPVPHPV
ncbi:hypothetical protein SAMN05660860_03352 [Geoalkalibacter ferrihydriticus]|uniref:Uncharacterized protein n=1 Tax=Geoalkalibacter ferrihydriticus TaxID=392333 RepID=A0A1G9WYD4_9BACT|nr:hypothetical protein SAMN05660860_03352 [Geoalkalibacter ferrihydriticus]